MIIGIDHLALTALDLDRATACLQNCGYKLHFLDRRVQNPETKRLFLNSWSPTLACAFLIPIGPFIPVEVLVEGSVLHDPVATYRSLWTGRPKSAVDAEPGTEDGTSRLYCGDDAARFRIPALDIEGVYDRACISTAGMDHGIKALAFEVPHLEPAMRLWQKGLGFSLTSQDRGGVRHAAGSFSSPFQKGRCDIHIIENPASSSGSSLDCRGFPCLAFTSTSVDRDMERLRLLGAREFSDVFELVMNGSCLRIVFFRGTGGEILELVEPLKQGGGS